MAKEMDQKSIELCPQGFESPRCRTFGGSAVLLEGRKKEGQWSNPQQPLPCFLACVMWPVEKRQHTSLPCLCPGFDSRRAHMPCSNMKTSAFEERICPHLEAPGIGGVGRVGQKADWRGGCVDSLRGTSDKIGTIQRRLAWPLRRDDTHKSGSVSSFLCIPCCYPEDVAVPRQ